MRATSSTTVSSPTPPPLRERSPSPTSLTAIARAHGHAVYDQSLPRQRRALEKIVTCQTAAQGVHHHACQDCDFRRMAFNSCRSRYCQRCLRSQGSQWFEARERELLDVPYFHVVFTFPHELAPLALQNQAAVYSLLFRAASRTLLELGADPKRLGGKLGFLAVLHTWGQNLLHHPHLHCVVPGGALAEGQGQTRWLPTRPKYLFPVRVLSKLFRGKFLAGLRQLHRDGELEFHGQMAHLEDRNAFASLLKAAGEKDWVVYAKPPFAGPKQVLRYLARYTHRIGISDSRIVDVSGGKVTFRWKDYANGSSKKLMTLEATEFLRRYLLHVLPDGFHRLRYFGFYSNRNRKAKLSLCKSLISGEGRSSRVSSPATTDEKFCQVETQRTCCPECSGPLTFLFSFPPRNPATIRPFQRMKTGPPQGQSPSVGAGSSRRIPRAVIQSPM